MTSLRADWWIGGGVGAFADLTHANSRMRGGAYSGQPLPEAPEWTATLGLGFLRPSQLSGQIRAVWTSERFSGDPAAPLPPVWTVDAGLRWQPLDKHIDLRLDAVNLFDSKVPLAWGASGGRRAVRLSVAARF